MAKLLFVCYGGGHVAMLLPVAQAAQQNGHEVYFLGLTTARRVIDASGFRVLGFADFWHLAEPGARAYGQELARQLEPGGVDSEESAAYLGISFAEMVSDWGESAALAAYGSRGRQVFLPICFMKRVLSELAPDVLITTNSPRAEQAAQLAAQALDLPSVCAVDLFGLQEVQWVAKPGYASRICVLNESVRQMFLAHGRSPCDVVVTGNPAFDALRSADVIEAGCSVRRLRGWDDGGMTILWASQVEPTCHPFADRCGDPELPRRIERILRAFVNRHSAYRLVVRYHPSEREVFEAGGKRIEFSPPDEDIGVLLHAVDIVVVVTSTVGLQAYLAGRQVVSVDCSVFTEDAPYSKIGISRGVARPEQLEEVLLALGGQCTGAQENCMGAAGGTATNRLLRVIESLIN